MSLASQPTDDAPPPPAAVGGDLKLSLACPQCGATGWVELQRLHNGLRCPQCKCNFLLGRHGKLLCEADLPHVRFSCPRCKQSGRIPAMFALRKVHCGSCKLTLKVGPDHQLHGEAEALEMRRAAARAGPPSQKNLWSRRIMPLFLDDGGQMRRANAAVAVIVVLGVLVVAGAAISQLFGDSAERQAKRFTRTCLAGDWHAAEDYLEDNDVARIEMRRWRSYHFTSILDAHRPAGDRVTVSVEPLSQDSQSCVAEVTMTSKFLGSRRHRQHWKKLDGRWRFDVLGTLREIDGAPRGR